VIEVAILVAAFFFGVGGFLGVLILTTRWLVRAFPVLWYQWKERWGFGPLEFVENTINELEGREPLFEDDTPMPAKPMTAAAGCLFILIFPLWHLIVTPIGLIGMNVRKADLYLRFHRLPPEKQQKVAKEYVTWLNSRRQPQS
jgi:hypothetical protein